MLIRVAMVVGSYYPLVADVRGYFFFSLYTVHKIHADLSARYI